MTVFQACRKLNGYDFDVFCILSRFDVFSDRVESWSAVFLFLSGLLFRYAMAELLQLQSPAVTQTVCEDQPKEIKQRQLEWSQMEQQG